MSNPTLNDPAIRHFRAALDELYAERLERAVLFGSRARGDARDGSDYDIAVFLRAYTTRWAELGPLAELTTAVLTATGADISAKPFRAGEYLEDRPLMRQIARDGLDL